MSADVRDPSSPRPGADFHPSAASILATEHWGVLGARSMGYTEALGRAGVFLTVLSAAVVALALVADATAFGDSFVVFALVLFPLVLFLGVATYVRLVQINYEDLLHVLAMNRLRRAYLQIAPELEQYFTTSSYDDLPGMMQTLSWGGSFKINPYAQFFITTPTVIATVDAIVAAAGAALIGVRQGLGGAPLITLAAAAFLVAWGALFSLQWRSVKQMASLVPRFPTPEDASGGAGATVRSASQ